MEAIKDMYRSAFREHGDTPRAVFLPKGRQELRWEALAGHIPLYSTGDVLDYGCGLAHMQPWLQQEHPELTYVGADMVPDFITQCRLKYPNNLFHQVSAPSQLPDSYKYTVASGIFNIKYTDDDASHWATVQDIVHQLWQKTTGTMSIDFMHTKVDYRQDGAYHQDQDQLLDFIRAELSPFIRTDFSYLPYEFSVVVFRPADD